MSKERELLNWALIFLHPNVSEEASNLHKEITELLAQHEPFKPDWANYMQGVEDGIYKAKPEHEPVTNEPTATAMAVMPNGELVSNVYDAYEAGIKSVMVEQDPVAWQFRTFHGEDTVCSGWDVWEDCTELKFNNVSEYVTKGFYQVRKLYTSPTKREPLSCGDIRTIVNQLPTEVDLDTGIEFCMIIEKAHGIGE